LSDLWAATGVSELYDALCDWLDRRERGRDAGGGDPRQLDLWPPPRPAEDAARDRIVRGA
jgi:hypothetical protein